MKKYTVIIASLLLCSVACGGGDGGENQDDVDPAANAGNTLSAVSVTNNAVCDDIFADQITVSVDEGDVINLNDTSGGLDFSGRVDEANDDEAIIAVSRDEIACEGFADIDGIELSCSFPDANGNIVVCDAVYEVD